MNPSALDIRWDRLSYRDGRRYRMSRRPFWQLSSAQPRDYTSLSMNRATRKADRDGMQSAASRMDYAKPSECRVNYFGARALPKEGLPLSVGRQGYEETKMLV